MEDKLLGSIGMARRAGRLIFGSDAVLREVMSGKALLVLLAQDASPRTSEKVREACMGIGTEVVAVPFGKEELGHAVGRGETAVAAVTDKAFAAGILEKCRSITGGK